MSLGPAEILVILVIALLVFGPHKLPDVGRQVGRTMREFRKFQETMRRDLGDVFGGDDTPSSDPPPMLPPKDPEASIPISGEEPAPEGPRAVAADGEEQVGEPATDAPPDASRSD